MAKSKKVVSKKVQADVLGPATDLASEPGQASTPVSAASPVEAQQIGAAESVGQVTWGARVPRSEHAAAEGPEEARAKWKRRLARWSKKAEAAGVDARALMQEALAGSLVLAGGERGRLRPPFFMVCGCGVPVPFSSQVSLE
jgi:hypothetical protein